MRKGLIIGIILSLVAGAGAAAVDATMDTVENARHVDSSPITVPLGRLGDRITYETFERKSPSEPWKPASWPYYDGGSFEMASIAEAHDAAGGTHATLVVRTNTRQGCVNDWFLVDGCRAEFVKNYYVSLERREIVSNSWEYRKNVSSDSLAQTQRTGVNTAYGPMANWISPETDYGPAYEGYGDLYTRLLPLVYQGHTFKLGDAPDRSTATAILSYEANRVFEGAFASLDFSFSASVPNRGRVLDHDSYDVRSEGCFRPHRSADSWAHRDPTWYDGMTFLGAHVPWERKVCFQQDSWVTADLPYPVLVERWIWVDGEPLQGVLQSLAAYEAGQESIPWGNDDAPDHGWPSLRTFERSGDVVYPAEGTGSRLPFGLTSALKSVDGAALLPRFAAWKAQHPNHVLIGYLMTPRNGDVIHWDLVFGDKAGSGFVVTAERRPEAPISTVGEGGEFPLHDRVVAGFPTSTDRASLAAADRLWQQMVPDEWSRRPANYIAWGHQYNAPGLACANPASCVPRDAGVSPARLSPTKVLVGHTSKLAPAGPAAIDPGLDVTDFDSYLVAHVTNVLFASHSGRVQQFTEFTPLGVASSGKPPTVTTSSAPVIAPPDVKTGVLVASSFLALFLAVYFFPLMKFLGGQVVGALPGYAKLHRTDLLNNRYRENILALVKSEPGITAPELQSSVGGSWTTIVYHLRVLEKNQVLSSLIDGRHKRFFPAETVAWGERGRMAALRNARTRQLFELIHGQPGLTPGDLAERIGTSRQAVYWHMDRLERVGLVAYDKERGRTHLFASDPSFGPRRSEERGITEVA